jgi:hypothetical protein
MRCALCGWILGDGRCPCGASSPEPASSTVAVGTPVVARPGRGPSMNVWAPGEVAAHAGPVHRVESDRGRFWCDPEDLLPASPERDRALVKGRRVWGLWLDGRWYPGTVAAAQDGLRRVEFDDGDSMWLETRCLVLLAAEPGTPEVGSVVVARHWNGEEMAARVEGYDDGQFRVVFRDGEEGWFPEDELMTFPPNPFFE